jgi:phospholipid/cholesterol/gamma-HCH transport system ATP-binding protein
MTEEIAIRFDHVSKSFGGRTVLDKISFDVTEGQAFCLMGRSGSGKSVTLRQMIGLIQPDSGEIWVRGQKINELKGVELSELRRKIGFLFQYSALFDSITVGENVAFPLHWHTRLPPTEIRRQALTLLGQVGLEEAYDKMPTELSGGMRKRAALARALALKPPILLVDEPSSGLDPITAAEIDTLLLDLKDQHGTTMVVVTHNIPSAMRLGDVLAILGEGRIIETGAPEQLRNSGDQFVQQFMSATGGT